MTFVQSIHRPRLCILVAAIQATSSGFGRRSGTIGAEADCSHGRTRRCTILSPRLS